MLSVSVDQKKAIRLAETEIAIWTYFSEIWGCKSLSKWKDKLIALKAPEAWVEDLKTKELGILFLVMSLREDGAGFDWPEKKN